MANKTFFNLYAVRSAFNVMAAATAVEDVMLITLPLLLDLSGNRLSRVEEGLDFWEGLRSSLDMREVSLLMSSFCWATAISILRYVRLMVSKVGALQVTMKKVFAQSQIFDLPKANFSRLFPL